MATASLPMYDFAELTDAHDALWAAVVDAHGGGLPATLTHADDVHALWHATDLAVSQACGWPLVDELDGRVRLIGAFSYDVPDAVGPRYRSRIVTRADRTALDPASAVAAVNSFASLSGWLSLVGAFPQLGGDWPGEVVVTGAHVDSLGALQSGDADIAAIDGVTFALMGRHRPHLLDGLAVIAEGPLIPCLPLIAGRATSDDALRLLQHAFATAVGTTEPASLDALLITGFHPVGLDAYEPVRALHAVWQGAAR